MEGLSSLGVAMGKPTASLSVPALHQSSLSIAKAIIAEDGARGLFRGLSVNYLKVSVIDALPASQLSLFLQD